MQGLWQRFVNSLTPAVRWTLTIWTTLYLLGFALAYFHVASVAGWLMLTSPAVWHGQVWRLASHVLMPVGLMDLLGSAISVLIFGGMLERIWSRGDFFLYCFIAAVGAGLTKLALQSFSPAPLLGPSPVAFALMAATGRLFANERIVVPPSLELTMRQAVILLAAISFIFMGLRAGWVDAVIRVSGGVFGLFYLWLRSSISQPRVARAVASRRINRLEL